MAGVKSAGVLPCSEVRGQPGLSAAGASQEALHDEKVRAAMRTRDALSLLIEGRLSSPDGRSELVEPAARMVLEK